MTAPRIPHETDRLAALRRYRILDSLVEREYDDLTAIAAHICGTPISLISLVDENRQWFKSARGLQVRETHRDLAFCAHAIQEPDRPLVVTDARLDPRFATNALVVEDPKLVFYAGVPLLTPEGQPLGTICVIDHQPRQLDAGQLEALQRLSRQVIQLLELRATLLEAEQRNAERQEAYDTLRDFSHIIAHDLKAPIRNISQLSELLREECGPRLTDDANEVLGMIEGRAADASRMIDGVLRYSKVIRSLGKSREVVNIGQIVEQVAQQLDLREGCQVRYTGQVNALITSRIALVQIFQNLIGNAIKHSQPCSCHVLIDCAADADGLYAFSVEDNGPGIPAAYQQSVFKLFTTGEAEGAAGHGVGLAIVKRLIEALSGTITMTSTIGTGTTFRFTLPENVQA